jgi:transcriptional regulator with XRE-family HTH domain
MALRQGPTVRRRRLGMELRKLREQADMTGEEVCEKADWSTSKLSRIETGRVSVLPADVEFLLTIYGAGGEEAQQLAEFAARSSERGWWHRYNDVLPEWFEVYLGLEAEAAVIFTYQAEVVPGLLQTEEYASALMAAAVAPDTPEEIERRVALRTARQARLTAAEDPLRLHAVINEAVLRRLMGGPGVMRGQLRRLLDAAALPTVTVQVLPFSAGAHPSTTGGFNVLEFTEPTDPRMVYVEGLTSSVYLEKPREVGRYRLAFDRMTAAALSPEDSVMSIAGAVEEFST